MTAIGDKFGKASGSSSYAVATTVKTLRNSGESVLAAYDLSNFALDTPVFFVTYKKTTDPVTGAVSITNQRSWKALVNPDNNTLTNLILAPGYTDGTLDVGDFIELMPTSFWNTSLIDGILTSLNADGTLKTQAVKDALGITGTTPPDWTVLPTTPTVQSSNAQHETVLRYTGVDYTPTLQPGTKLRVPRTGTVPTTSFALVGASSQYASRPSANVVGLTQTDNYTAEALIWLDQYPSSGTGCIISRYNAKGWIFRILNSGQVNLYGGLTTGSKEFTSYQSIPLGRWVHVAVKMSMAAGTAQAYIDGVPVPGFFTGTGTSFDQSGVDLQIGRFATGDYFTGKIANIRVWSAQRTDQEIRENYNKEVPTSTTNLIIHFKGNGSWSDSSTNANHMTNIVGAINNYASHPFSAVEYAYVTAVALNSGNTDVTVFSGKGYIPNEVIGATSYSSASAPFGFPVSRTHWLIKNLWIPASGITGVSSWTNVYNMQIAVPTGAFRIIPNNSYQIYFSGAATHIGSKMVLSSTQNATGIDELMRNYLAYGNYHDIVYTLEYLATMTSLTYWYVNIIGTSNTSGIVANADGGRSAMTAELAYY